MSHLGGCVISGDKNTWGPEVWDYLIEKYDVKSIIDIGCGAGHSLDYFLNKGLDSVGIEGWDPAIQAAKNKERIIKHDFVDGKLQLEKNYDMVWCCEFVEHVYEKYVDNFFDIFQNSRIIAMTHGLPNQGGYHHVNCQAPEYWINKIENLGFIFLKEESEYLKNILPESHDHGYHIKNSLLIFKK